MLTFQDFEKADDIKGFIIQAINEHKSSEEYDIAMDADLYDHQKNSTIENYLNVMYSMTGEQIVDFTAANSKIASNFFHRLNVQRNTYLLGNGITFKGGDATKEKLGTNFDLSMKEGGYLAQIHGVSYGFWNVDKLHFFPLTEFKALPDEKTSTIRAGIRFWQLDESKPLIAVLYEEDGYTRFEQSDEDHDLEMVEGKKPYKFTIQKTDFAGEEVIDTSNYSSLPIIPLYGSRLKQSTLVGMKRAIDSYDLIRSGFANDLTDVSQIYWLIENASGMDDDDLQRFRDRLKLMHIGNVDVSDGTKVTPYTQDIPYQARKQYLDDIRSELYEGFGALDVHAVAAGATNDHIDAAYQPMDEEADDFEFQVTTFIKQLLKLIGIEDEPLYKRNRISNMMEQTSMILSASEYLDQETVLNKLPFVTVDEVKQILKRRDAEDMERFNANLSGSESVPPEDEEESEEDDESSENS